MTVDHGALTIVVSANRSGGVRVAARVGEDVGALRCDMDVVESEAETLIGAVLRTWLRTLPPIDGSGV
jgi:hypothetical protein